MRLIDADMLKKYIISKNSDAKHFLQYIDEQPTAQKEKVKWISVEDRLPEDIDMRFFMCLVEEHLEDPPMMCQYEEEYGFGFWTDTYDPITFGFVDSEFYTLKELGYEKVLYWMPLIALPRKERQTDNDWE